MHTSGVALVLLAKSEQSADGAVLHIVKLSANARRVVHAANKAHVRIVLLGNYFHGSSSRNDNIYSLHRSRPKVNGLIIDKMRRIGYNYQNTQSEKKDSQ